MESFVNAFEIDLIYQLSGLETPRGLTVTPPASAPTASLEAQVREVRRSSSRNRFESALGRANSPSINEAPVGRIKVELVL